MEGEKVETKKRVAEMVRILKSNPEGVSPEFIAGVMKLETEEVTFLLDKIQRFNPRVISTFFTEGNMLKYYLNKKIKNGAKITNNTIKGRTSMYNSTKGYIKQVVEILEDGRARTTTDLAKETGHPGYTIRKVLSIMRKEHQNNYEFGRNGREWTIKCIDGGTVKIPAPKEQKINKNHKEFEVNNGIPILNFKIGNKQYTLSFETEIIWDSGIPEVILKNPRMI